jgi:thioredoxin-related protein
MKFISKVITILLVVLMVQQKAMAQVDFDVPEYTLVAKEDYAKYEKDIIDAAQWLEEKDLDKGEAKRKRVGAFVFKWLEGSPTVTLVFFDQLGKIYGKNTDLLIIYIARYCAYCIQHKEDTTSHAPNKAALTAMMAVYKKDINIKKSKEMENLIKQTEEGKLDEYIDKYFTEKK